MDMKSRRIHTVTFLCHSNIASVCASTGHHVAALLSSCPVVLQTNLLNKSIEMVLPTSEHFSNKRYAVFVTQSNLCNFHFAKCSSLNRTRLLFHEIKPQNLHLNEIPKNVLRNFTLYFALYYTQVLVVVVKMGYASVHTPLR